MSNRSSNLSPSTRKNLQWLVMVLAIILTVISIVDIARGEGSIWEWVSVVCWPLVALASAYNIRRFSQDEAPQGE